MEMSPFAHFVTECNGHVRIGNILSLVSGIRLVRLLKQVWSIVMYVGKNVLLRHKHEFSTQKKPYCMHRDFDRAAVRCYM